MGEEAVGPLSFDQFCETIAPYLAVSEVPRFGGTHLFDDLELTDIEFLRLLIVVEDLAGAPPSLTDQNGLSANLQGLFAYDEHLIDRSGPARKW